MLKQEGHARSRRNAEARDKQEITRKYYTREYIVSMGHSENKFNLTRFKLGL